MNISGLVLLSIIVTFCTTNNTNKKKDVTYSNIQAAGKNEGSISFGLVGMNGVVINNGSELSPSSNVNIETIVNIEENTNEVDFIIIKKPDYLLLEQDIKKASVLQEIISMRFRIRSPHEKRVLFDIEPKRSIYGGPNDNVFLSDQEEKLKFVYEKNEIDKLFLSIGNIGSEPISYAVVALFNWKQVPLIRENEVLYVSANSDEREIFEINLPETNSPKNYQILAFPDPYEVRPNNYRSHQTHGSFRVMVKPDQ